MDASTNEQLASLPKGMTCGDCRNFKRTCSWLISCEPTNEACDWIPSRFSATRTALDAARTQGEEGRGDGN